MAVTFERGDKRPAPYRNVPGRPVHRHALPGVCWWTAECRTALSVVELTSAATCHKAHGFRFGQCGRPLQWAAVCHHNLCPQTGV